LRNVPGIPTSSIPSYGIPRFALRYASILFRVFRVSLSQRTEWVLAGFSKTQIQDRVQSALATNALPVPEPSAMCYWRTSRGGPFVPPSQCVAASPSASPWPKYTKKKPAKPQSSIQMSRKRNPPAWEESSTQAAIIAAERRGHTIREILEQVKAIQGRLGSVQRYAEFAQLTVCDAVAALPA
jgi:hypothetical protein